MIPPEPQRTNQSLQQEISRMAELFENTRINYQVLDENGTICYVNEPWLGSLGYTKDKVIGMPFHEFLTKGSKEVFHMRFRECRETGIPEDVELELVCADGSEIIASYSCFCHQEGDSEAERYHCTFQNNTRLRATEQALKISEAKYERIFRSFQDVYYQADEESRITLISPSVEKLGGYKPEELIGRSVGDFFRSPEERALFRSRLFTQGSVEDYDLKLRKKDGSYLDASLTAQLVRDKDGRVLLVEGILRDISRRKSYESRIASYNSRLNDITENLPVVLFQVSLQGRRFQLEYVSNNVHEQLGFTREEIMNDPGLLAPVVSSRIRSRIEKVFTGALSEKRTSEIEYPLKKCDGTTGWSRVRVAPRENGEGEKILTGISIDITEEVALRRKITEQELQLRALYQFSNVGIATMSLKGVITSINPAVQEITGFSEEEIVGKHFKDVRVFYKKDLPFYLKLFAEAVAGRVPDKGVVFQYRSKSGESRWAEAFLNLIREGRKIKGFQGVFIDVTDRILLQQSEKEKQRDRDFLFSSAVGLLKVESEDELFKFLGRQIRKLVPESIININSINEDQSELTVQSVTGLAGPIRSSVLKLFGSRFNGMKFSVTPDTFSYSRHGKLVSIHNTLYDVTIGQVPRKICEQVEKVIRLREIYEISIGVGDQIMGGCAIFLCGNQQIQNQHLIENLCRQVTAALIRIRAREELVKKEELYRSLAENAQDFILRVGEHSEVLYANQAFQSTFDLELEEMLGNPLGQFGFPPSIYNLLYEGMQKTIDSEIPQCCDIVMILGHKPRFLEWRMFPEKRKEYEEKSVIIFIRDRTDMQKIEATVQDNAESRNRIFRLIGHDLKVPFNGILGFLDLLTTKYEELSDEMKKKYIQYIKESSNDLYGLLNSLQEWSKNVELEQHFNPAFFEVRPMTEAATDLFKLKILEKKLEINNTIPPNALVKADYNMIASAIRNLLSNAIKFSSMEGRIDLLFEEQKEFAVITIRDYGQGISEEGIQKLLNPEESFSTEGTMGETGTGFGFRFATEFIRRNDGWIRVESKPGEGCRVDIGLKIL